MNGDPSRRLMATSASNHEHKFLSTRAVLLIQQNFLMVLPRRYSSLQAINAGAIGGGALEKATISPKNIRHAVLGRSVEF